MTNPFPPSALLSSLTQKRFSKYSEWGLSIYGFSNYGDEFIGIVFDPFGGTIFGRSEFGDYLLLSGLYQLRNSKRGKRSWRVNFYNYVIKHAAGQQTNREKFDAAVVAWQGLTEPQREVYREKAKSKHCSGYNLYLREYLLSN